MGILRVREFTDNWAYDLDIESDKNGEIRDINVIDQSIELILGTLYGERLFNPTFGFGLQTRIFELNTPEEGESLLDEAIEAIKKWEDRIIVLEQDARIMVNIDQHMIILIIPYIVKKYGIKSIFKKKIISV